MIKLYRNVLKMYDEIYYCPWKLMDKHTIYDVKYDAHLNNCYINGDKNCTWHMEFKDVATYKDYLLLKIRRENND